MNPTNPKVDEHIEQAKKWQAEMTALRHIILTTGLSEELKWDQTCYTHEGANIVLIGGFKDHYRLMFCQGSVLKDPYGLLQKPGEHTQAGRFIPFTSVQEIKKQAAVLKEYLYEAIETEKAGVKPVFKSAPEPVPEELAQKMAKAPALKKAFAALTPGRQRAYLLHFNPDYAVE